MIKMMKCYHLVERTEEKCREKKKRKKDREKEKLRQKRKMFMTNSFISVLRSQIIFNTLSFTHSPSLHLSLLLPFPFPHLICLLSTIFIYIRHLSRFPSFSLPIYFLPPSLITFFSSILVFHLLIHVYYITCVISISVYML